MEISNFNIVLLVCVSIFEFLLIVLLILSVGLAHIRYSVENFVYGDIMNCAPMRRKTMAGETYDPDSMVEISGEPKTEEQKDHLKSYLKNVLFMKKLDHDQIQEVVNALVLKEVSKGELVITQGDEGDYFYIVEKGVFKAWVTEDGEITESNLYENEGFFGELALLMSLPRAATVRAETDGLLWSLDRSTFRKIVVSGAHKSRQLWLEIINSVSFFCHLSDADKLTLTDAVSPLDFPDGTVIIEEGDDPVGMFFILDGRVEIYKSDQGVRKTLLLADKGEYFGERSLMSSDKRVANARAVGFVKTAFLNAEAFRRLLGPCAEDSLKRSIQEYNSKKQYTI